MDIKLILVSREGRARQTYLSAIEKLGIRPDAVSSFTEFHNALIENDYNGVLVDLLTKIKAASQEKELIHQILELYPVAQLKWEEETGLIRVLYLGRAKGSGTLEDFIYEECGSFKARAIRSSPRVDVQFNVLLSRASEFSSGSMEKTVTVNVSREGCFVFSLKNWDMKEDCWLKILELGDDTPIRGEIRWAIPWGKAMKFPGIGIRFKEIKKNQSEEICSRIYPSS